MPSKTPSGDPDYYVKLMDELKDKFMEQVNELEKEISTLSGKIQEAKIKNDNLERNLGEADERIKAVQEEKSKLMRTFTKSSVRLAKKIFLIKK